MSKKKQGPEPNRPRIARILGAERALGIQKAAEAHGVTQAQIKRWAKQTADDEEVQEMALAEYRVISADWRKALCQSAVHATDTLRGVIVEAQALIESIRGDNDPEMILALLQLQRTTANDILEHMTAASAFPEDAAA